MSEKMRIQNLTSSLYAVLPSGPAVPALGTGLLGPAHCVSLLIPRLDTGITAFFTLAVAAAKGVCEWLAIAKDRPKWRQRTIMDKLHESRA